MCILTDSYVEVESQLKDKDRRNYEVTDSFLSLFNDVAEPHTLVAYIISTKVLQQLQGCKDEDVPTYGELFESLNQPITDPIQISSRRKGTLLPDR